MKPELFQTLFRSKTLKIERIVSRGHATPEGKWLRGRKNEWVRYFRAHRVEWTKPVWLAVLTPSH